MYNCSGVVRDGRAGAGQPRNGCGQGCEGRTGDRRHRHREGNRNRRDIRGRRPLFDPGGPRCDARIQLHRLQETGGVRRYPLGDRRCARRGCADGGRRGGDRLRHAVAPHDHGRSFEGGRRETRRRTGQLHRRCPEGTCRRRARIVGRQPAGFRPRVPDPRRFVDQPVERPDHHHRRREP